MKRDRQLQKNPQIDEDPAADPLGRCYALLLELAAERRRERTKDDLVAAKTQDDKLLKPDNLTQKTQVKCVQVKHQAAKG